MRMGIYAIKTRPKIQPEYSDTPTPTNNMDNIDIIADIFYPTAS